ncbi:alpha-amylase family glycosyl hydrolase [Kordiimonas gwangyangensis]|uniref:alpha-amylase family glycosyl hydrolase n=1 Tax=Kordiimonas gwangyangensis TaxID=288022 RepID=UPI00037A5D0B|nr:alpha-amylase family glycosyl hydrolase [Kordiimonas gwangyangensis]
MRKFTKIASALLTATMLTTACGADLETDELAIRPESLRAYSERPITEDVMYFVMPDRFFNGDPTNDRGGIDGGVLDHGFDPTHKGFYHGGDIEGLTAKLDYLADMGVSAIWLTPIFKNKAVQGNPEGASSGYHGYWITDFTQIDPHLGSNDDLKAFVAAAHERNMKVIFDIITNHTADVIKYEECLPQAELSKDALIPLCEYRSKERFPYTTKGGRYGEPINEGFLGDEPEHQTASNFAKLKDQSYAYTPYVPEAEKDIKVPAWLNDVRYYHNRGDSEWKGESSLYGDFAGLDDLFTEHPLVKAGFIDIYKFWISEFGIDGFRIDTVRHVNDSFWQAFAPAILEHAKSIGIPQFYIFGEVYDGDPEKLSHFTRVAKLPAVLDFGFQGVATDVIARGKSPMLLSDLYAQDGLYDGEHSSASILPTFLGNHDMGRIGRFIATARDDMGDDEALARMKLAHALMYATRGIPVIYYGDEQGFTGDGNDQDAREDMFESQVASYNDNDNIGTDKNPADDNFDQNHPMYDYLVELANFRRSHTALQGGAQNILFASEDAGIFAFERLGKDTDERILLVFNTANTDALADFGISAEGASLCHVAGTEAGAELSGGRVSAVLPPLSWTAYSLSGCTQ